MYGIIRVLQYGPTFVESGGVRDGMKKTLHTQYVVLQNSTFGSGFLGSAVYSLQTASVSHTLSPP